MRPRSSPRFLLSALCIFLLNVVQTHSRDPNTPFAVFCASEIFKNSSGNYEPSLRRLFTSLVVSASNSPSLFSSINSTTPPKISGLAQCRPDLTPSTCAVCLNNSVIFSQFSSSGCWPNGWGAFRSSNCLLRYSYQAFNGTPKNEIVSLEDQVQNVSALFTRQVGVLLKGVMRSAADAPLRFAAGVAKYSEEDVDIHGMGWCSIDLVSSDCAKCLNLVSASIPSGKSGGSAASANCEVRFSAIKTPFSPQAAAGQRTDKAKKHILIGTFAGVAFVLLLTSSFILLLRSRNRRLTPLVVEQTENEMTVDVETVLYSFDTLRNATADFSKENKLGQGGFGPVYKGVLESGQEIAVKRLSRNSRQGLSEMKNEIHFIAKLQHKNLVKLLGYCLEGEEKLLVYEYLPNRSLDHFLFDPVKRLQLNWKTRLKIIEGIGRSLLYLHEDSHFKVIHRDLKASNILLDGNMNPKISDFGLAKLFGADETHKNTRRIAGTYGYMAPEYALRGRFSAKSDVFSYGVLVLEIITGRKNSSFQETDLALGLPSCIWHCWNEGMGLKVVDETLGDEFEPEEVLRHIQIGLLCVQEDQALRPSMTMLALMQCTNSVELPTPRKPAFYAQAAEVNCVQDSVNDLTISVIEAR